MQENMMRLFAAHSPTPETMRDRCEIFFSGNMSVCTLIKKPENEITAFVHAHDEYEFIIPHTPIPFLLNDGAVYFGEVGYIFPVHSGRSHGFKYSLTDISHSDIVIRKEFLEAMMERKGEAGAQFNYEFRMGDDLKFYIDAFKREFRRSGGTGREKLELLCNLICMELIAAGTDPALDTRKEKHGYQKGIQSAAEFMNDNYHREIELDELAAMCGFSKNYFIKMFKSSMGESPHSYLIKLRISQAKLLLESTAEPITRIAEKCGFKRTNSFTSQFKTSTGMTPTEYRDSRG